jgi:hypothetical protein
MEWSPLIVIVVAVIAIGIVWRIISGIIRLVFTIGILAVAAYLIYSFLR